MVDALDHQFANPVRLSQPLGHGVFRRLAAALRKGKTVDHRGLEERELLVETVEGLREAVAEAEDHLRSDAVAARYSQRLAKLVQGENVDNGSRVTAEHAARR